MITMTIAMMINLLSGMKVIKNARLKKPQENKGSYPLLDIYQGPGIGVFLRMGKKK